MNEALILDPAIKGMVQLASGTTSQARPARLTWHVGGACCIHVVAPRPVTVLGGHSRHLVLLMLSAYVPSGHSCRSEA